MAFLKEQMQEQIQEQRQERQEAQEFRKYLQKSIEELQSMHCQNSEVQECVLLFTRLFEEILRTYDEIFY